MENQSNPAAQAPQATSNPAPTPTKMTAGSATTSLVLGLLSFIPLVGVLLGVLAIVFGILAKQKIKQGLYSGKGFATAGIILGILGILSSVAIYGSLFYFGFVAKGGPFAEARKGLDANLLTQDAGMLELYKVHQGHYPQSLDELQKAGYQIWPADGRMKPFFYKLSADGSTYDLRGLGEDEQYGTSDDVFPVSNPATSTENLVTDNAKTDTQSPIPQNVIDNAFGPGYKAEVAKITGDYSGKWAFDIPLRSQEKNLVITSESWMKNPSIYDKELTALENNIRDQYSSRTQYWAKVLVGSTQNDKERLTNDLASTTYQKKIIDAMQHLFTGLLQDRDQVIWGTLGKHATDEQMAQLQPLWSSLIDVTGDCSFLLNKKIVLEQQLLQAIDAKDKPQIINTEADIRTIDLVYSWHQDGYDKLNAQELALKKSFGLPQ